ncbi:MAG TPA: BTAD domain-containing putative transcriptional regulator, partial [Micromonosporaceae bacterium]|nr:BTAD domain-containing putative transcriptional regulator [Micromonosporaceae bacterium]
MRRGAGEGAVRIQVLGPICAWRDGKNINLGATRQRAMLGLLALAGGQPLSRAELIEALWGDRPPSSAVNVIQTYVKHLRRSLEPDRPARTRSAILPAVGDGYALRLAPDDVDVLRFRRLVTSAGLVRRAGDPHRAAALLGEGLAMWQGAPLCDVAFLASHPKVVSLTGERHSALVRYGELMIATGAAADTVAALEEAAAAQPLDEAVTAVLIRAYLAVGQRSKAFARYHETRHRLADELGVDPGPDLSAAHAELLRDNGSPAVPGTDLAPAEATRSAPAQLPADVSEFTGRTGELTEL